MGDLAYDLKPLLGSQWMMMMHREPEPDTLVKEEQTAAELMGRTSQRSQHFRQALENNQAKEGLPDTEGCAMERSSLLAVGGGECRRKDRESNEKQGRSTNEPVSGGRL